MKILFVLNIGFDRAGPSVHLLTDVISAALEQGNQCHVVLKKTVASDKNGLEELIQKYGDSLTVSLVDAVSDKKLGFVKRYLADCRYAIKTRKYYRDNKYGAAFLQSCNVAWLYARFFKRKKLPFVFNVQDIFPQNLKLSGQLPVAGITYPVFCRLQGSAYKKASRIITVSDDMKQTLTDMGVCAEKINVVFNWSYGDGDISLGNIPSDRIFDLRADGNKTNVVYAGNIGKMQNAELIAEAARLSRDDSSVHYYIIGDGANKKRVEAIVEGLDNVTVLPMQPSKYAESIYAQADINVIPLAKGGIKTALPSKTATVLRTDKPVIFCIDPDSTFEKMLAGGSEIKVANNSGPESLYEAICEIRDGADLVRGGVSAELRTVFSRDNSKKYVEAITEIGSSDR